MLAPVAAFVAVIATLVVPWPAYGQTRITGDDIFFLYFAWTDDAKDKLPWPDDSRDKMLRLVYQISPAYRKAVDEFARKRALEATRPIVERRLRDARNTQRIHFSVQTVLGEYDFDRRAFPVSALSDGCRQVRFETRMNDGHCSKRLRDLDVDISFSNADDMAYMPVRLQDAELLAPHLRESRAVTLRVVGDIEGAFAVRRPLSGRRVIQVRVRKLDIWSRSDIRIGSMELGGASPMPSTHLSERSKTREELEPTNGLIEQRDRKSTSSATDWQTACAPIPTSPEFGAEHVRFEHCLRTFRFRRLAESQGVRAPSIEPLMLAADESPVGYPVPALRLAWENDTFFDTGEDQVLDEVVPVLNLVALALKRDIGDASLYVVGHTDSRGGAEYNEGLSLRRAKAVVEHLADADAPRYQIDYTGMGERQPIAPNNTKDGRSLNRRVEFLISAFRRANIELVRIRPINESWLDHHEAFGAVARPVEVFSLGGERTLPEIFELPPPISQETYVVELGGQE